MPTTQTRQLQNMLQSQKNTIFDVIVSNHDSITTSSSLDFFSDSNNLTTSESSELSGYFNEIEEKNPVQLVIENEAYCFDVCKFSEKLVDAIFLEAQMKLSNSKTQYTILDIVCPILDTLLATVFGDEPYYLKPEYTRLASLEFPILYSSSNMWPMIFEFNIKLGQEQIEQYVDSWKRSSDWMFCVEFLGFEGEDCSNIFIYEVEWSKPTKSYPIPQATASVYFALEVYKIVPYSCDRNIDVSYIFESSGVIHKPGKIDFQEQWLQDIIDEKIKHFRKMTFSVPAGICGPTRPTVGEDYWPNNILNFGCSKKSKLHYK